MIKKHECNTMASELEFSTGKSIFMEAVLLRVSLLVTDFLLSNLSLNKTVTMFTSIPQSHHGRCFLILHSESMEIDNDI